MKKKLLSAFSKSQLFNLTLFLQLHLFLSLSENHFGECLPKKCGNHSITYPFHIINQQESYCGYPGFEVSCNNDRIPLLNISGNTYLIKNIWYESMKFQIINSALVDSIAKTSDCFDSLKNMSFRDERFKFATNHSDIYVLPNCSEKVLEENKEKRVKCGSLAMYRNDSKLQDLVGQCNGVVIEVPYNDEDMKDGRITDMLEREVLLNWKTYNCTACLESNGQCGYDADNNQFNCYCPDRTHALRCALPHVPRRVSKINRGLVAVGSTAGVVILIAFVIIYAKRRQIVENFTFSRTKGTIINQNVEAFLKSYGSFAPRRYKYAEITRITNNFKEKLGEGGFGAVYKGKLRDNRFVAVKKLKPLKGNGTDFINEVVSIGRTNHVNIVTLLGFCVEGNKQALVYEFLSNGSLEKFIYSAASGPSLPADTLFSIAVGIAKGLDYLHQGCNTRILHFDIKPHNILLDDELRPKISDFGLARLCPTKDSLVSMSEARGTIGYIAPEVFCRNFGGVSHKSDVYSYGMMLLDLVCGRNNVVAEVHHSSELYFPDWIYRQLEFGQENELEEIKNDDVKKLQRKMVLVSLWCIQSYPSNRPSMNKVLEMLEGPFESIQVPPKPQLSSPLKSLLNSSGIPLSFTGN